MVPAHKTKHLPCLVDYPFGSTRFSLTQSDDGNLHTTGSTLWLGAQVLSLYLRQVASTRRMQLIGHKHRKIKAIELGSGIGLSALALASLGCDVVATDVKDVISTVLKLNIANNLPSLPPESGTVQVRELDWTVSPDQWTWDDQNTIASSRTRSPLAHKMDDLLKPPFDLIITSDTLYHPDLVHPLFRAIHALSTMSSSLTSQSPGIYLCVERRDPALIDRAFLEARETWGFKTERIAHKKLVKVIDKAESRWDREDWEGVEIWKLLSTRVVRGSS